MSAELSRGRRLAFSAVLLFLTLLGIEVLLQAFYYATAGDFLFRRGTLAIFDADPTRCFRLRPNLAYAHRTNEFDVTIYTNSQGHRTDARRLDVPYAKPAGVVRILFLGPSFPFGWGNEFEDAYPTLLGEQLRTEGAPVEVLNLGTPAQLAATQLCWLRAEGFRFEPDVIVQTLYGDGMPAMGGTCPEDLECPVVVENKLYSTLPTWRLKLVAQVRNLASVFYGYYLVQSVLSAQGGDVGTGKELYPKVEREGDPKPSDLAEHYRRYEESVHQATGRNTPVEFLFIPLSYAVHPGDAARWRHLVDPDPEATRRRIRTTISELRGAGFSVIDSTGPLIDAASRERMYYWLDIHLTRAGNRVVADAALPALRELVESRPRDPAAAQDEGSSSSTEVGSAQR